MANRDLPQSWIGTRIPTVRKCDYTYCEVAIDSLPSLNVEDNLDWLHPLHPAIASRMEIYRPRKSNRDTFHHRAKRLILDADSMGLRLPNSFKQLIFSEELQVRVPSVTACYFDLPDRIVPSPFESGGHIIRFLNDQQICVNWYIGVPEHGEPIVFGSYSGEHADFLEELDLTNKIAVAEAFAETKIVSRTFQEFLKRFWIENCIWFKIELELELTSLEADYIQRIKTH